MPGWTLCRPGGGEDSPPFCTSTSAHSLPGGPLLLHTCLATDLSGHMTFVSHPWTLARTVALGPDGRDGKIGVLTSPASSHLLTVGLVPPKS